MSAKPWIDSEIDIPFYSNADRERIERLLRRLEHLEERIKTGKYLGEDLFYDKGEASSIRYVLWELGKFRRIGHFAKFRTEKEASNGG